MKTWLSQLLRVVHAGDRSEAVITGRKIYILPTRYGMVFGVLLLTLLIASINYANNPAFILTFLLTGAFIQTIFYTWRNLLGLHLRWRHADSVCAGETSHFHFQLFDPGGRAHYSIQMGFPGQESMMVDCSDQQYKQVALAMTAERRGRLHPGRLTLESRFPLGLLRAWCYLDIPAEAIIWPRPMEGALTQTRTANNSSLDGDRGTGTDDFVGYRGYHPGDSLAQVSWKALAAEKGLLVKQFGGDRVDQLWLDFSILEEPDTERRLGILTHAVLKLSTQPVHYGLRLGDLEIQPDNNERHRRDCLTALALYGEAE
ncbi:DUF58 domain-containing protein [Thiolapillus sp.]